MVKTGLKVKEERKQKSKEKVIPRLPSLRRPALLLKGRRALEFTLPDPHA